MKGQADAQESTPNSGPSCLLIHRSCQERGGGVELPPPAWPTAKP